MTNYSAWHEITEEAFDTLTEGQEWIGGDEGGSTYATPIEGLLAVHDHCSETFYMVSEEDY